MMRFLNGHRPADASVGASVTNLNGQQPISGTNWTRVGQKSFLAILLIANLGLSGLIAILILSNVSYTRHLAKKPAAALVQLTDGTSISVTETPNHDREPEVIRKFVTDSLIYLMNWSADLPSSEPTSKFDSTTNAPQDAGVDVTLDEGFTKKVTTPAWQASFTLEEEFRTEFLQKLATMTPEEIFAGNKEVVLKIREVGYPAPQTDTPGAWSIDVVADLMVYSPQTPTGKAVPFNKRIYVQSIDVPPPPAPNTLTPLAAAIYAVRLSGLEITGMRDLQLQEFTE
ncbi:MAG: hypothetical protein AAFO59_05370 [Cyanobacteria bacterium J06607_17]